MMEKEISSFLLGFIRSLLAQNHSPSKSGSVLLPQFVMTIIHRTIICKYNNRKFIKTGRKIIDIYSETCL